MKRVIQLQEISQVSSGYQFRDNSPELILGNWRYIQMRDIDSDNIINPETVLNIDFNIKESSIEKYQLNSGDILFKNRGAKNNAAIFNFNWPQTIASHQFLIVRINDTSVIPEYIAWYINSTSAQIYFRQQAAGTNVLLVQKRTLEELEVVLPHVELQKKIVEIHNLQKREKHLVNRRLELQDKFIDNIISESLKTKRGV